MIQYIVKTENGRTVYRGGSLRIALSVSRMFDSGQMPTTLYVFDPEKTKATV